MAYKGTVIAIFDVQTISDKFRKREVVLSDTNDKYPQEVKFQAVNDKVGLLDGVKIGDVLEVEYNLRGRRSTTKDGKEVWYNSLDLWRVNRGESMAKPRTAEDYNFPDTVPF